MKNIKIAITYEKGGVGKTTTAVNLSAVLAEKGYKVLLVDLDFQSYATSYFGLYAEEGTSIYEVMTDKAPATSAFLYTGFDNLYLLPCKQEFKNIETILMMKTKRQEYTLKTAMNDIENMDEKNQFDFIIMDCPPNGARIKENALAYADYVILATIPDDFAIHGLRCMATELVDVKQYVNPTIEVMGILLTLNENTAVKKVYTEALRNQTLFPCFSTTIRKNTTLSEAANHNKPINYYKRKCNGFIDYTSLADEVLKAIGKERE